MGHISSQEDWLWLRDEEAEEGRDIDLSFVQKASFAVSRERIGSDTISQITMHSLT
jgi:hypothetical protein